MIYKCCDRQVLVIMDHRLPLFVDDGDHKFLRVNRLCMRCYAHWAGDKEHVKEYTKAEWDALMDELFDEDEE